MQKNAAYYAERFQNDISLCTESILLGLGECGIRLRSNSAQLLARLNSYFNHVQNDETQPIDIEVIAIEHAPLNLPLAFQDWPRETDKTGRKDAYLDIPGGRLLQKVRTGMLFLQSETSKVAIGPCISNDNQVINFINSQYMNWLQQRNWLICHAAGVSSAGRGLAMAGFSGGGKSTLMLHLLEHEQVNYLSNDRLFIRKNDAGVTEAAGIPKLPRINPGTIINNPKLAGMILAERRQSLLELPTDQLWDLDEKYDVDIDQVYGENRIVQQAPLSAFMVLNWDRSSNRDLQVHRVDITERTDLLRPIMKSPGPFYQCVDGSFLPDSSPFDQQIYLDQLTCVPVYEAFGRFDFQGLSEHCLKILHS